jgi:ankyrin repeat protein
MDINDNLFNLVKSHKWEELIKTINNTKDLDCNIRDSNNNYLIQYVILYNKIEIIKLLIEKGAKLDVTDIDGRSLLFIPIKYNYDDILETILENDKNSIGISLLEFSDNKGLFPIHYTILFNNLNAINIILKYITNIDTPDNDGNTALHLSIQMKNLDIFNQIIKHNPDVNYQTNQGESPLHIACNFTQIEMIKILLKYDIDVNIQDYENHITPLMYSIILDNTSLFNLLIDKSNVNIQDINGNNPLHYAINENNYSIINSLTDKYVNLYSTNLSGKTPLHLLLDSIKFNNIDTSKFNFTNFIKKSNLNIQDYNGDSSFILIIKLKLWKKMIDILKEKKLNAFLKNHDNKTSFDYINQDDEKSFLDLLTESYINILRKEDIKWKNNIDNYCKNKMTFKKFESIKNDIDIDINEKDIKKWDKDMCPFIIRQIIINKKISFPTKLRSYCIDLDYNKSIAFVTYTGVTLDIMFGLIYILKNYNNVVTTSLSVDYKDNQILKDHYMKIENRHVGDDELLNFEIIWNNQKLFIPSSLDSNIQSFKENINKRFLIIPVGIELSQDSHANILIYDKKTNELERFEPNGATFPYKFNYNPELLDKVIKDRMTLFFEDLKYIKPIDFLPKIGFQLLEAYDHFKTKKIGDPGGFCGAWCTWYAFMRVKYENIDRIQLTNKLIRKTKELNIPFKNLIRNFANKITNIRDDILKEVELDINDWLNSNYNKAKLDRLFILLQQSIKEFL